MCSLVYEAFLSFFFFFSGGLSFFNVFPGGTLQSTSGNRVRLLDQAAESGALSLPSRFSVWVRLQWTWVCIWAVACGQQWLTLTNQFTSNNQNQNAKKLSFQVTIGVVLFFFFFSSFPVNINILN